MSNRQMLYLLITLTVVALGARFWAVSWHGGWKDSLVVHQKRYQDIYSACNDLAFRREKAPKGTDDQAFRLHFQNQAFEARLGTIDVTVRDNPRAGTGIAEKSFTIGFENAQAAFQRQQIRLFLFNSELLYPRIRSTQLSLAPAPSGGGARNVESGAPREDLWRITKLEFKQRSPVAAATPPR
jgi:hypothetical protein